MKKSNINWTVKNIAKNIDKGIINFNYPIQREGGQWDNLQQSLLIHSIASDYPIPAIYAIAEKGELNGKETLLYQILDGKQRLTNIAGFVNGDYALHEDTPKTTIDGEEYELSEMIFDELNEEVQDQILSFAIQTYKLDEFTDEEVEDLFFRLNNGTPLSKQQKAKAKMGKEWAEKVREMISHPLMKDKASFTKLQIRKADNETALMQAMMLLDDNYEVKSISSNDVFKYTQTFREDEENKLKLVDTVIKAMNFLNEAYEVKESVLLKKVHFPMTIINALKSIDKGITPQQFAYWTDEFKDALKEKSEIKTDYKEYGGAGSVKKEKTLGRIKSMESHINEFFEGYQAQVNPTNPVESKKEKKSAVEPKEETKADKKKPSESELKGGLQDIASEIASTMEKSNK